MPNWCACYLELESQTFKQWLFQQQNEDRIANMSLILTRLPRIGIEPENWQNKLKALFALPNTAENLNKLETLFQRYFPQELVDDIATMKVLFEKDTSFPVLGRERTAQEIIESLKQDWQIHTNEPTFSLFSFVERRSKKPDHS